MALRDERASFRVNRVKLDKKTGRWIIVHVYLAVRQSCFVMEIVEVLKLSWPIYEHLEFYGH